MAREKPDNAIWATRWAWPGVSATSVAIQAIVVFSRELRVLFRRAPILGISGIILLVGGRRQTRRLVQTARPRRRRVPGI